MKQQRNNTFKIKPVVVPFFAVSIIIHLCSSCPLNTVIPRVLYVNFVTVLWDIFLSYIKHRPDALE